jgi:hypothetical protein
MHWETSVFGLTSLGGMDGPHRQQLLKVKALLLSSATLQNQNFHSCVGDLCIQNKATNYSYITLNERHMSSQRTIYHLIVDRSGSMSDCIDATINGFNEQINRIRSIAMEFPEQDIRIGYTIFNFSIDMPAVAQDLNTITPLSRSNYVPTGSTALYDAIGKTTLQLEAFTDHHSDLPVTYVVVVLTDGYENASQMFTLQNIRSMISRLEATGRWTFSFIGATLDAVAVAAQMSFKTRNSFSFEKREMNAAVWHKLSDSMEHYLHKKRKGKDLSNLYDKDK